MNCKKLLKIAAYDIISQKAIDKVNVTDIIKAAEISKQTFYRYYSDKYALANDIYYDLFIKDFYNSNIIVQNANWTNVYLQQFETLKKHYSFVKSVFSSREIGCTADFDAKQCIELDKQIIEMQGGNINDPVILFAIEVKDVGGTEYMRKWILNGMQVSCHEMANRFKQVIPNILVPYFK